MSKHTPGPWFALPGHSHIGFIDILSGIEAVAQVTQSDNVPTDQDLANANLIAAAPDLLDALKDAYPHIGDDALRARIGAVICNAEGV